MSDSDQKYRRVHELSQDNYMIEVDSVAHEIASAEESWRGRYVELFEFSPIPYLVLNQIGIIEEVNLATCQLFGKGASRFIGERIGDATGVEGPFSQRFIECLQTTTDTVSMENSVSATRTLRFIGARIDDMGIEKIRVAIVEFNPKTTIERDDARLTNVLLQTTEGFLFYDGSGALLRMNRQARSLLRNHPTDSLEDLLAALGSDGFNFKKLTTALQKKNLWRHDYRSERKGAVLRCKVTAIVDEEIGLNEVLVTVTEVEHTVSQERQFKKLADRVRDPLTSLKGALQLIDVIEDADAQKKLLDIAVRNARMIEVTLNNVLSISESDSLLTRVRQPVRPLLDRAVQLVQRAYPDLRFEAIGEVEFESECDEKKLTQAFHNFLRVVCHDILPGMTIRIGASLVVDGLQIDFSPVGESVQSLGLEESSAVLLKLDYEIAKEIVEGHGGSVRKLEESVTTIRVQIR